VGAAKYRCCRRDLHSASIFIVFKGVYVDFKGKNYPV
jgi:hypothetical protein